MKSRKTLLNTILIWVLAVLFWQLIQLSASQQQSTVENSELIELMMILIVGALFGTSFSIINWGIDKKKRSFDKLSYGGIILVYAIIHLLAFLISIIIVIVIYEVVETGGSLFKIDSVILDFVFSLDMLRMYAYTFVVSIGIFLVKIINQKFGPGILKELILGRYRKPKEKRQIFLFMDLKSSTSYAEQLGHQKYSSLIQDCFVDVTKAAIETEASIYQYVGDEVVFTWPYAKGINKSNCVNLYFKIQEIIHDKSDYYHENYGLMPEFKAGLNGGTLMAAEVGVIKRSIAYHGDVINTASRLQSLCGELNKEFLISNEIIRSLPQRDIFKYDFVGDRILKGKKKKVGVYECSKK